MLGILDHGFKTIPDSTLKSLQDIKMREDLVGNGHHGYCEAIKEWATRFKVNYIGGCCGCGPEGIKKLQEMYF